MTGEPVYRACSPVVDSQVETDGEEALTETLVKAITEAKQVSPTDTEPIYETIDPDAINRLFKSGETPMFLTVPFEKWVVFIRTDGRIRVCDTTQPSEPVPVFEGSPD